MSEVVRQIAAGIKLAIVFGGSGAIIACCMVAVCRFLKWAPVEIDIVVNVNQHPSPPNSEDAG
jgi:hypothetical protein